MHESSGKAPSTDPHLRVDTCLSPSQGDVTISITCISFGTAPLYVVQALRTKSL